MSDVDKNLRPAMPDGLVRQVVNALEVGSIVEIQFKCNSIGSLLDFHTAHVDGGLTILDLDQSQLVRMMTSRRWERPESRIFRFRVNRRWNPKCFDRKVGLHLEAVTVL